MLAIVALLPSLAAPRYYQSLDTARETILIEHLAQAYRDRKFLATQ